MPEDSITLTGSFTSASALLNHHPVTLFPVRHVIDETPFTITWLLEMLAAEQAIDAKGAQLGSLAGGPIGDAVAVRGGWMRPFQGVDVYFGKDIGAFEVHGDIRAKYNALGGANGLLGLPVTDETGTPDGVGRFNHFQGGSIYWTPSTGPMMVRSSIRDVWAAQGWETGPLGYPVADEHRLAALFPVDHPKVAWSLFENGAIVENVEGTHRALAAELDPGRLRCVLRGFFDRKIHESPDNIGLHAPVETTAVSGYGTGFWSSQPRMVTFRLHGFHDNGLAPDTDFELNVRLRFGLTWTAGFTEPPVKTLVAALDWISVTANGLGAGSVANGVANGVKGGFFRGGPEPGHPEVPDGAVFIAELPTGVSQQGNGNIDVVDVLVSSQGGLQVLVPVGPIFDGNVGTIRQLFSQNTIDSLSESQGCG